MSISEISPQTNEPHAAYGEKRTTGIEWTEHTWNPILGCSIMSAGCTNCYAMEIAHKLDTKFGIASYDGLTQMTKAGPVWTGKMRQAPPNQVNKPKKIARPSVIFVNSMSDLFHPDAEDSWRDAAFEVMRTTPRHIFQTLTKRPDVAARYISERPQYQNLPNVWIGTTVERGDVVHRIDTLRTIPAVVRFLSVEPLIGSLGPHINLAGIDWVITGGESGPKRRIIDPAFTREVNVACVAQSVPHFHKQWGNIESNPLCYEQKMDHRAAYAIDSRNNGKGGALIDGVLWRQWPTPRIPAHCSEPQHPTFL